MDPEQTLRDILERMQEHKDAPLVYEDGRQTQGEIRERIIEKLEDLTLWLHKNGLVSKVSTIECGDPNGPEAHGYFIGEFVTYE